MSESSNLCLSCGLCCEGAIIGFVQLDNEEALALKEIRGDIEDENGHAFFLQPCSKYCDGCTIYESRPKKCASFKCDILTSVEQKEIDFDSAVETTKVFRQKKNALEKRLATSSLELKSESFYFKMVELKNLLQKNKTNSSVTENYLELTSELEELNDMLTKSFGTPL